MVWVLIVALAILVWEFDQINHTPESVRPPKYAPGKRRAK